jgi:hypothetical protein
MLLSYAMSIKMAVLSFSYNLVVKKQLIVEANDFILKYCKSIQTNNYWSYLILIDTNQFFNKNYLRPPPFQA